MSDMDKPETGRTEAICRVCQGDGYLDESTLSKPVYCTCEAGIAVQRKDTPLWLR